MRRAATPRRASAERRSCRRGGPKIALARLAAAENIAREGKIAFDVAGNPALGVTPEMKKSFIVLSAVALLASPALAATPEDSDGNGTYSMEEMVAANPELTEEQFADMDTNGDGAIDAEELQAAIDGGMIEG